MERMCPNCQRPNPPDAVFCRNCAASLPAGFGGQAYAPPRQNQQWHQPPPGGQMQGSFAPPMANTGASGRAIASLILTICSLVLCCGMFTSIPGAILGWIEVNAIKEGRSSPGGLTMAQIGMWGGIVMTVLSLIGSVVYFLMILAAGGGGF